MHCYLLLHPSTPITVQIVEQADRLSCTTSQRTSLLAPMFLRAAQGKLRTVLGNKVIPLLDPQKQLNQIAKCANTLIHNLLESTAQVTMTSSLLHNNCASLRSGSTYLSTAFSCAQPPRGLHARASAAKVLSEPWPPLHPLTPA